MTERIKVTKEMLSEYQLHITEDFSNGKNEKLIPNLGN